MDDASTINVAAIDIGTNSVHLLIGQLLSINKTHADQATIRILDSHKVVTRLGAYFTVEGSLEEEAIDRCVAAVGEMIEVAKSYRPIMRVVATHATRVAKNHAQMVGRIHKQYGVDVEVIDGVEEARLAALGMDYGLSLGQEDFLGVDIGGGSTEIVINMKGKREYISLDLGSVVLSKLFFPDDNYKKKGLESLNLYLNEKIVPALKPYEGASFDRAVLCSGIAKALAQIVAQEKNLGKVIDTSGFPISHNDLVHTIQVMEGLGKAREIYRHFDLEENRAQIILVGLKILEIISSFFHLEYWQMCSYGLREGVLVDAFAKLGHSISAGSDQANGLYAFGEQFRVDFAQAERVSLLALAIFDSLSAAGLKFDFQGPFYRRILAAAAFVHECGCFVNQSRSDRHGYYLVLNAEIPGLGIGEKSLIALLVRHQIKGEVEFKGPESLGLSQQQVGRVNALAVILRMAVYGMRCRQDWFSEIKLQRVESGFEVSFLMKKQAANLDMQRLEKAKEHLEKVLQAPLQLMFKIV